MLANELCEQPDERGQVSPARDVSIVIPVYFNAETLGPTLDDLRTQVVAANPALTFEVIWVDDGSGDRSLETLLQLRNQWPDLVRVVKLSRNFGQAAAIEAGYRHSRGRMVVELSADRQDPVSVINEMIRAHEDEGCEVVIGVRRVRDDGLERGVTSRVAYELLRRLSFRELPPTGFDFVMLGRRALRVFLENCENHGFFQGQILWLGFRRKFIPYDRLRREQGVSRWTFGRRFTYLIDGITAYSFVPLRCMSLIGVVTALTGFAYAMWIVIAKLIFPESIPVLGWAPLMIVMLITSGLQMSMVGVIGEYLWRTLSQVRQRARYIVEEVFEQPR